MKRFWKQLKVAVAFSFWAIVAAEAGWHGDGWKWNSGDLGGSSNSVQVAVDELDQRVDAIEGGAGVAAFRNVIGESTSTIYRVESGTCTNGQPVTFTYVFSAPPYVAIQQMDSQTNSYPTLVLSNGFTANLPGVAGVLTGKWCAVGLKP